MGSWSLGSLRPLEAKIPTSTRRLTFTYSEIETVNSSFNYRISTALPCAASPRPFPFYAAQLFTLLSPRETETEERERGKKRRAPSWDRALNEHNQVFTCCFREGCQDAGKHHVGRLGGIHGRMDPSLAVVGHQGGGLGVIGLQPGFQGRFVIIRAADQGLSSDLGEARGQSPASCSLGCSPLLSLLLSCKVELQRRPQVCGGDGANPGQPEQVPEQSLKREGLSTVVFSPTPLCLLKGASRAGTSYSCSPGWKPVTTHRNLSSGQSPTSSEAGRA